MKSVQLCSNVGLPPNHHHHHVELPRAMACRLHLSCISDLSSTVDSSAASPLSVSTYVSLWLQLLDFPGSLAVAFA